LYAPFSFFLPFPVFHREISSQDRPGTTIANSVDPYHPLFCGETSYAPELNPDEGVWSLAKRQLANGRPDDVDELMEDVIRTMESIRSSPTKLRGCLFQSELPIFVS
jgi:hypothetical protein